MLTEYDERFDELTGLVKKVAGRVDEVHLEMRDMRKEMREVRNEQTTMRTEMGTMNFQFGDNSSGFDKLEAAVQVVAGKQDDVIPKVIGIQKIVNRISETQSEQTFRIIEILNRLNVLEIQLRSLTEETTVANLEIKEIREAVHSFIDPIQIGWDLRENLSEIERRVTDIEKKLAN